MAETLIANLSDEDLSRWIAERLEPWDLSVPHQQCAPTCAVNHDAMPEVSPLRFWWLKTRPQWHWQPRDMIHDPAMTVMLLSKLADRKTETSILFSHSLFTMHLGGFDTRWTARTMDEFGCAVAEAFALASGWTPEAQR